MTMQQQEFVFDPRPELPLRCTVKRYVPETSSEDGVTLILFHATGMHKETWEPLLDMLCSQQPDILIHDAWSIECPNHGTSASLNDTDLKALYQDQWNGFEYPKIAKAFLVSDLAGVDFKTRRLVGIGHSMGGNTLVLLQSFDSSLHFIATILLDATIGRSSAAKDKMNKILTQIAWSKQDVWASPDAAIADLKARPGTRSWHPGVLELFVKYGMKEHSASHFEEPFKFHGVTLACSKSQEAACYRGDDHHEPALQALDTLFAQGKPIHMILSQKDEFNAAELKQEQMDASKGRTPASVQWIPKGGHMFVQSQPTLTAEAIGNVLRSLRHASGAAVRL